MGAGEIPQDFVTMAASGYKARSERRELTEDVIMGYGIGVATATRVAARYVLLWLLGDMGMCVTMVTG